MNTNQFSPSTDPQFLRFGQTNLFHSAKLCAMLQYHIYPLLGYHYFLRCSHCGSWLLSTLLPVDAIASRVKAESYNVTIADYAVFTTDG